MSIVEAERIALDRESGESPATSSVPLADPGLLAHLNEVNQHLFVEFGWGPTAEPSHRFLHQAFEAQVRTRPEAVAIEHGDEAVSYHRLNQMAETVADELRRRGVGRGELVGLFIERSIPMVAAMLGTLKAGAAYAPQHAGVAPKAQLEHVMAKTQTKVVLTLSHLRHHVPAPAPLDSGEVPDIVDLDILLARSEVRSADDASWSNLLANPDDPCFVLFTSGTTGPPNGVVVTHRNVANVVYTSPGNLGIEPGMRVGQILSVAFDMAEWEIFGALGHGATLVIRGKGIEATVATVDVVISTPSILASIDADRCRSSVKVVAVAGEPCPESLANEWGQFARFHNSCGPTETTIVNTVKPHTPFENLTIGAPTPNNTVYVLDENLRPLPIGEIGEMWAGGDCVTAGYLGDDDRANELNADRYRDDPFLGGGRKMFRTRDLGRWTVDGELEHFGRTDDQVKVRGFRVELDSVSAVLEAVPECNRAVTLKYDDRSLVAFVEPEIVDADLATKAVGEALPYYCVPAQVFPMATLPRTDRGKIDKGALRELAVQALGGER